MSGTAVSFQQRATDADTPFDTRGMTKELMGALHGQGWIYAHLPKLDTAGAFHPDRVMLSRMPMGSGGNFSPVARFETQNRIGLAVHITLKQDTPIPNTLIPNTFGNGHVIHGVVTLYTSLDEYGRHEWTLGEGHTQFAFHGTSLKAQMVAVASLQHNADEFHRTSNRAKYCSEGHPNSCCHPLVLATAPQPLVNKFCDFVCDVLSGNDPYFEIVNPQNVPPPEEAAADPDLEIAEGQGDGATASCWERFCVAFAAFLSWLCCCGCFCGQEE